MRRLAAKMAGVLMVVVKISAGLSSSIIMAMMVLITVDVILRYIFNRPIPGSYNLVQFLLVGVVFLSIAYVQSQRGHVKMDVATSWMSAKNQKAIDVFGHVLGIVLFSIIAWQGGKLAWKAWVIQDYTMGIVEFPLWPAKSLVPFGFGLLSLQLFHDLISDIVKLLDPDFDGQGEKGGHI